MMSATTNAKQAIREVLYRYALMVDERDWELIDRIFTRNATIDYTSVGNGGTKGPHREMLSWLDATLKPWPINLHFISNILIDVDGDEARATCYFNAPMGRKNDDGTSTYLTNAGVYRDRLVRTADGWRIHERVCDMTVQILHS